MVVADGCCRTGKCLLSLFTISELPNYSGYHSAPASLKRTICSLRAVDLVMFRGEVVIRLFVLLLASQKHFKPSFCFIALLDSLLTGKRATRNALI